eukprot:15334842-Alexandrium_andersonii.AAC.1
MVRSRARSCGPVWPVPSLVRGGPGSGSTSPSCVRSPTHPCWSCWLAPASWRTPARSALLLGLKLSARPRAARVQAVRSAAGLVPHGLNPRQQALLTL